MQAVAVAAPSEAAEDTMVGAGKPQRSGIRVFVHTELSARRPVFTPGAHECRGAPTVCLLPVTATTSDFVRLFNRLHRPERHRTHHESKASHVDVFLTRHGAQLGPDEYTIREDDCLLIRGAPSAASAFSPHASVRSSDPREVEINYKILRLSSIDTVRQTFYCDFLVIAKWLDVSLAGVPQSSIDMLRIWCEPTSHSGLPSALLAHWPHEHKTGFGRFLLDVLVLFSPCACLSTRSPKLEIENAFEPFQRLSCVRTAECDLSGLITEVSHFKGTLFHALDLTDFPFDNQGLCIQVQSAGEHSGHVLLSCAVSHSCTQAELQSE